jgi:hypothetical protein
MSSRFSSNNVADNKRICGKKLKATLIANTFSSTGKSSKAPNNLVLRNNSKIAGIASKHLSSRVYLGEDPGKTHVNVTPSIFFTGSDYTKEGTIN